MIRTSLFYLLFLYAMSGSAAVLDKAASGFVIEISVVVDSTPESAYAQFLRINEWWDGEHSWFGKAENFTLDARAGGCFCEVEGERQVQHMTVSFVEPNKEVRMLGGLGPLQMMGVHGAMSWKFDSLENGQTRIMHRYSVSGYVKGGLDQLADIVDQVQTSQVQRLKDKLNKGSG